MVHGAPSAQHIPSQEQAPLQVPFCKTVPLQRVPQLQVEPGARLYSSEQVTL